MAPNSSHRVSRVLVVTGLLLVSLCMAPPRTAQAQYWMQTARIVTPVDAGPLRAFLDTLVQVAERKNLTLSRRPSQETRQPPSALRTTLVKKHGLTLTSANTLFVDYRFAIDAGSELERKITGLHFVFRPGPAQKDIPIVYVNAQKQWVQDILWQKGTPLRTNLATLIPFRHHLEFAPLARLEETQLVEIGGETIRKGFSVKKEALIRRIRHLAYVGIT